MRTDSSWPDLSLVDFCEGLSGNFENESGAPAAALLVATGAALAAAAQRGESDSPGAIYAKGRAAELDALRERALKRMETTREILEKLNRKPDEVELEKLCKRRVELVLETVELAVAALRISIVGAPELAGEAAGELAVAAGVLAAGAQAVEPEVRRSVATVTDQAWGERHSLAAKVLIEEASALLIEVQTETSKS